MSTQHEPATHRAFIGLGSNLGDRSANLQMAIDGLPGVHVVSPMYETDPIGGPEAQPDFLNCVVELHTDKSPRELLTIAAALEGQAQRVRTVVNGPRTLDVDILLYDDVQMNDPDLIVPHPRMWERRFVIQPLLDIAPDVVPPSLHNAGVGSVHRFDNTR